MKIVHQVTPSTLDGATQRPTSSVVMDQFGCQHYKRKCRLVVKIFKNCHAQIIITNYM